MSPLSKRLGGVTADAAERLAVAALAGLSELFSTTAARGAAGGYNRLFAGSSLGSAVGRTIHHLGSAAQPNHLLVARADRRLHTLIGGNAPGGKLGELERIEFGTRHVGLAATTMMLWVIPFIFGTNPSRLRLKPKDLAVLVRRFRELLVRDMDNIGKVFPRDIACLTHIDLDPRQTAIAFQRTHTRMLEAIRSGRTARISPATVPPYRGQQFHWRDPLDLSSGESWDAQVDTLFAGLYGAMQRSLLPDILEGFAMPGCQNILEVGGGTGPLANFLLRTLEWRRQLAGVTLDFIEPSPPNMALAKRRLSRWGTQVRFFDFETTGACAEKLPHRDASLDKVIAVNLFHELPPKVRRKAAAEFARVLRPGGRLHFLDSAQLGDGVDSVLTAFGGNGRSPLPRGTFHEPFYASYLEEDLVALFARYGFVPLGPARHAYVAKQMVLVRQIV